MKLTKKAFREELNKQDAEQQAKGGGKHKNYQYRQVKRLYGDYLYSEMFRNVVIVCSVDS
jgi:hypothetical protein